MFLIHISQSLTAILIIGAVKPNHVNIIHCHNNIIYSCYMEVVSSDVDLGCLKGLLSLYVNPDFIMLRSGHLFHNCSYL